MKSQFSQAMNWGILQQERFNQSHMIRWEQAAEAGDAGRWGHAGWVTGLEDAWPGGRARLTSGLQRWIRRIKEPPLLQLAVQRGVLRVVAPCVVTVAGSDAA